MRRTRFFIGIALLVQAASFLMMFILLCRKRRSLSLALLTIALAGGIGGALLLYRESEPVRLRYRKVKRNKAQDTYDIDESLFDDEYPDEVEIYDEDSEPIL